ERQLLSVHAYGTYYSLSLFNNFTFFLNDPDNGDEINQRDRRVLAGVDTQYAHRSEPLGVHVTTTGGLQYRLDTPHIVLANTAERHLLDRVQDADVIEQSYSPFLKFDLAPLPWLRLVTGARGDVFTYHVSSRVNSAGGDLNGDVTRARPNVKANVVLGPWSQTEFFANFGTGFHSNDARAVILDPKLPALPTARGWEFGVKTKVLPRVELSATYWVLDLASELVFIGDDGTTQARGPSHREGWEFATRVKLLEWLTFSGDVTTSRATFDTGAAVPLAPRVTGRADLAARLPWGFAASLDLPLHVRLRAEPLRPCGRLRRVPQGRPAEPVAPGVLGKGRRELRRQLDAVHDRPRGGPRARDVGQVVAAPAQRHEPGREGHETRDRAREPLDVQVEVRERVGAVGVDAELGDDDVGLERADERRHDLLERREVDGRVGERFEREVHGVAEGRA